MSYGANIKTLRERKGLSQKSLAEWLSVTPQAVSRWEKEEVEPSVATLKKFSHILGVSVDQLLGDLPPEDSPVEETAESEESEESEDTPEEENTNPVGANSSADGGSNKLVGVCIRCGKALYEGDEYFYGSRNSNLVGRGGEEITASYSLAEGGHDLLCKDCIDDIQRNTVRQAENRHDDAAKRVRNMWIRRIIWIVILEVIFIPTTVAIAKDSQIGSLAPIPLWCGCIVPEFFILLFGLIRTARALSEN